MTAAHRVASRSPDSTGMCFASRSAPSQCERVTRPSFSSPNQPDQERATAYRDNSGPESRSDAHCATIVGDWEEPSGESPSKRTMLGRVLLNVFNTIQISLKTRGVNATLGLFLFNTLYYMKRSIHFLSLYRLYYSFEDMIFIRKHSLKIIKHGTEKIKNISEIGYGEGNEYQHSPSKQIWEILSELDILYRDYFFVDYGSGLGNVLFIATIFPFKRIMGVEISQKLHAEAKMNIAEYQDNRRESKIECYSIDARDFEIPDGNVVFFIFNPFGAKIMEKVIERIKKGIPGQSMSHDGSLHESCAQTSFRE